MEKDSVDVYPVAPRPSEKAVEIDEKADPYVTVDPYVTDEEEGAEEEVEELVAPAVEEDVVEEAVEEDGGRGGHGKGPRR